MYLAGKVVGVGDYHGAGFQRLAGLYVFPFIPYPGDCQRRAIPRRVVVGLLAGRRAMPLVIT